MMLLLLAAHCYAVAEPIANKSAMGSVRGVFLVNPRVD
jgi:hypothetical protein